MLFLIALAIALIFVFFCDKTLKKNPGVFYIAAAVLTSAAVIISQLDSKGSIDINNDFAEKYLLGIFTRGAIGAAFWVIVMWAGALPNGSAPIKKLMPVRGELSILAAVLTMSHIITYGIQYISDIINKRTGSGDAFRDFVITSIVCLILVLIMVPLTVMSFKKIRKKMSPKTWKKIQRAAYVFYGLIYVHIMVLFVPKAQKGREGYFLSIIVYSIVFIGYAVFRLRKLWVMKKKPEQKLAANIICACGIIIPVCLSGFISRNANKDKETITATKDKPATFTFEAPTAAEKSTEESTAESTTENKSGGKEEDKDKTTTTSAVTTTGTGTTVTTVTTSPEEATTAENEEPDENIDQPEEPEPVQEEPQQQEPQTEPEPAYKYKNGTYEGTAYGYAGDVHVSITIENDYITGFTAYADDDDPEYFSDAMQYVIPQIQSSMSADGIDSCSGATYSSGGLIEASRDALSKALN